MKIRSTFRDYYDAYALGDGPTLDRIGGNVGPDRRAQFVILQAGGWRVPPHGPVGEVLGSYWGAEQQKITTVVAYHDPLGHSTEGKALINLGDGYLEAWPGMYRWFCSAFLGNPSRRPSVSWRRLQVGRHVVWLECRSFESWMSNKGDGDWTVIGVERDAGYHPTIRQPLFAVDFVLGKEMYAVDFNSAPGMRGTGVERVLPGSEVVESLERAIMDLSQCSNSLHSITSQPPSY